MTCTLCTTVTDDYLCPGCTVATADRLDAMPARYEALAEFLHPGGRRPEFGRTRPAEAPLPIVEPVFNLRGPGGIVGVLEDWRSALHAVRGLPEPQLAGSITLRVRIAARGLALNLDWAATRWEMAGQFAEEMRTLERQVEAILDPEDPAERAQEFGPCPRMLGVEAVCGAVLLRRPGRQGTIECTWCGGQWAPERWLDLADAQRERQAVPEPQAA
ncbi:hypothetical protein [Streptomyces sp. NPDC004250]|uniref:hypothetical protein n=1 Tax=Streptomyces sp. NPDC004250 TaxID=3364692 RepID=UPI00368DACE7